MQSTKALSAISVLFLVGIASAQTVQQGDATGTTQTPDYVYKKVGMAPIGLELANAAVQVLNEAMKVSKGNKQKFVAAICKVLIGNVETEASERGDEKDTSYIRKNVNLGAGLAILTMGPSMPGATKVDLAIAILAARATWTYTRFIKPGKYTDSVETRAIDGVLDSRDVGRAEYRDKAHWRSAHLAEAVAATQDPTFASLDSSMDGAVDSMVRSTFPAQIASMQTPAKTYAGAAVKKLVLEALGSLADK